MANLAGKVKNFFKEIWYFGSSKHFLKNLGIALAIFLFLMFLVFMWLRIYTRHGESITIPDFTGQKLEEVKQAHKKTHFKFVVIDSIYDPKLKPMTIVAHNPPEGSKVKEKRKIYVTVNSTKAPLIKLPNLYYTLDVAKAIIESRGLILGKVTTRPDPATNAVLEVRFEKNKVKEGFELPKGSKIDLVIADGMGNAEVPVPSLVGMTLNEAKFIISSSNLNLGVTIFDGTVTDSKGTATIWRQRPSAGQGDYLKMGEQIDLWLTNKKDEDPGGE